MAVKKKTDDVQEVSGPSKEERRNKLLKKINTDAVKKGITTSERPIAGSLSVMHALRGEKIPTGNLHLDLKLGGGLTRGTSTLLWGAPGGGKSQMAMMACSQAIAQGGTALWIQTDPGDPTEMARIQGIPEGCDRFIHFDVMNSGEHTFEILQSFLTENDMPSDLVDIVVIDSIAGLAPREELAAIAKDGLADSSQGMSLPERMMSRLFRIMHSTKMYDKAAVILISEARVDLGSYGSPLKAKGGNATMHGVRLNLRLAAIGGKSGLLTTGSGTTERVVGHKYKLKFIKDGLRHRWQHYEFENEVYYGLGLDNNAALYQLIMEEDGFVKTGGTHTPSDKLRVILPAGEFRYGSEAKTREALKTDSVLKEAVKEFLRNVYSSNVTLQIEPEEDYADRQIEEYGDLLAEPEEVSEEQGALMQEA